MRKAMYLMGALEDQDIEWLGITGAVLPLAANQVLVQEGQPIDSLFIVLDGQFSVQAGGMQVAILLAGEVIGEISFVDSRPPLARVTALGPARVLAIRRGLLQAKLAHDLRFAANFYRALAIFLADRLRGATTRLGSAAPAQDSGPATDDELGDDLLETVSLGSRRFDNLLRRVQGG